MMSSDEGTRPDAAAPAVARRPPALRQPALRPPALRPGDQVAVLSVSSPADPAQLAIGLDALRFAGLDPVLYPSAHDQAAEQPERPVSRGRHPAPGCPGH